MPRPPAMPPLLRQVLAHWGRERTTLRQGFTALGICIGVTMVAGIVLGAMEGLLERLPGLLILIPAAIGMRGAIFGALGARLGTGILTGQYTTGWEPGTFTRENVESAGLLSVATAGGAALIAWAMAGLFGLPTINALQLSVLSMVGAVLASVGVLGVVLLLARTAQARSWDMDAIGTPIISAMADITTLPALVLAALLLGNVVVDSVLGVAALGGAAWAAWLGLRHEAALIRRTVRESLPVLGYAAVMDVLAGTVLSARLETLVTSPALLVAVPPFIASCGALGGILSARLASQLHLGLLNPRRLPEPPVFLEGSLTVLFALTGFTLVGAFAWVASLVAGFESPGLLALVATTFIGGLFATVLLVVVAYYAATASYRFGLDPDNYGIPIVTATMDFFGIVCLVAGISLAGVS